MDGFPLVGGLAYDNNSNNKVKQQQQQQQGDTTEEEEDGEETMTTMTTMTTMLSTFLTKRVVVGGGGRLKTTILSRRLPKRRRQKQRYVPVMVSLIIVIFFFVVLSLDVFSTMTTITTSTTTAMTMNMFKVVEAFQFKNHQHGDLYHVASSYCHPPFTTTTTSTANTPLQHDLRLRQQQSITLLTTSRIYSQLNNDNDDEKNNDDEDDDDSSELYYNSYLDDLTPPPVNFKRNSILFSDDPSTKARSNKKFLQIWKFCRQNFPPIFTGVWPYRAKRAIQTTDSNPLGAIYNMIFVRTPVVVVSLTYLYQTFIEHHGLVIDLGYTGPTEINPLVVLFVLAIILA